MGRGGKPAKSNAGAKRPAARKSPKNDAARVRDLEKRLAEVLRDKAEASKREAEAQDREAATAEILRVISRSHTDVQPVFDAIVQSAVRLLGAYSGLLTRVVGDQIVLAALTSTDDAGDASLRAVFPRPLQFEGPHAQAIRDRVPLNIIDAHSDPRVSEAARATFQIRGRRSQMVVPLLRHDEAVGAIAVTRREPGGFTDDEIALLKTFADHAVIAIENVRLFTELQEKNSALTESLGQQTATSEILTVISSSPTDVQPVFTVMAASAARLCEARDTTIFRVDGDVLRLVAHEGPIAPAAVLPLTDGTIGGRVIRERRAIHVADMQAAETHDYSISSEFARNRGFRTILSVPLLHGGQAIGLIAIRRTEVRPFTDRQVELVKTFADQAVIAIENVRLFNETKEALEQQTATSEILRVIASSPTDVQPVFDAVAESAARLCEAFDAAIFRRDGDDLRLVAHHGPIPIQSTLPLVRGTSNGRAVLSGQTVHVADMQTEAAEFPEGSENARLMGHRTVLAVPLIREEGVAIGTINVRRTEAHLFTEGQVALLQTFADQAIIAIENVRLFNETKEALEQQTATSDILGVISRSPTDVQPVFDAVAESAARLCDGVFSTLISFDGELMRLEAAHNWTPEAFDHLARRVLPAPPSRALPAGRAILDCTVIHLPDIELDQEFGHQELTRAVGFRSILTVPMLRDGVPLGAISVARAEPGPFSDNRISLLKTFADQAVIAIENVRLFTELQASNRELTTALDTQTATSDILRVISRSQTDVQPVFDAILASAVRLLGAYSGALTRIAGDQIVLVALTSTDVAGDAAARAVYPHSPQSGEPHAQVIRDRVALNIADTHTNPRLPEATRGYARARGFRSWVVVPMVRHDEAVGAIGVTRRDPGGFNDDEIALLKTFADQAVIAIENARLLTELQARTQELSRTVGELQALGEVGQAISSTLDLRTVLSTIVARATQLSGTDAGVIYEYDEQREIFEPRATERLEGDIVQMLVATPVRKGQGATGRLAEVSEPIQLADLRGIAEQIPVRDVLLRAGYRALLAVPLVREDHLIGGLTVFRKTPGEFAPEVVELLKTFATQSALAIQNARLFREIEDKSRQLEVASQHKSEFLANMSHELRTPLNAIIGFSEVLGERMFGGLNEKQEEYLKDIHASGQHLLSLINDILDLSKIEAGRMELELTDFHLPTALDNALTLVRERAGRRSIILQMSLDERLGEVRADERKIRQVALNLLSNAIKFTPEGGRIEVRAVPKDGFVEVSVSDTGVGIAPEDQEAVFEEFRQVGTAAKKVEGTGLGLTLCRKFVELHGGRIWVKSEVDQGSTFTFTIPVLRGE